MTTNMDRDAVTTCGRARRFASLVVLRGLWAAWPLVATLGATLGATTGCGRAPSPRVVALAPILSASPAPSVTPPAASSAAPPASAPTPLPVPPEGARRIFDILEASSIHDFQLEVGGECERERPAAPPEPDAGPPAEPRPPCGRLTVRRKGTASELLTLPLEAVMVVVEGDGPGASVVVNSARLYDEQGTLIAGDFDFDGREDFAIQVGHDGPYGGPTFDVYLDRPGPRPFVRSNELSELTRTTLGFFQVDAKRKRIATSSKSGCCFHVFEELTVVGGTPKAVSRTTEDAFSKPGYVVVTSERLVGSTWRRSVRQKRDSSP